MRLQFALALLIAIAPAAPWGHFWGPAYTNLGGSNATPMTLEISGVPKGGRTLVVACFGLPPGATAYLLFGLSAQNLPVNGGKLVPQPLQAATLAAHANADGTALWVLPLASTPPTFYAQALRRSSKATYLSNAVACIPALAP